MRAEARSLSTMARPTSSLPKSDHAARGPSGGPATAYVGLGSNLGERGATLREALARLGEVDGIAIIAISSFRETDPVGNVDQPRFLNAAAALETSLGP